MTAASAPSRGSRWRGAAFALALVTTCILPVVLYVPFLNEPFQRDEGMYATVGRMLLHGDLPYRHSFDNKPPLVFAWYALSFVLFGENVWAPRLLVSLLLSITTAVVYFEGKLLFSRRAGLVAALAFALSIGIAKINTSANTEFFLVLPMTGGLLAYSLARRHKHLRLYFLCGALNGLAIITKETALVPFLFLMVFEAVADEPPARTRAIASMAVGGLVVGLAALAPFIAAGAFSDFWDSAVVYTLNYFGAPSTIERLVLAAQAVGALALFAGLWCLLSILAVFQVRRSSHPEALWLIVGWTLASYAAIALVGRYTAHYFGQTFPGMALLVPAGLVFVLGKMKQSRGNRLAYAFVLTTLAGLAVVFAAMVYGRATPSDRHLEKYPDDRLAVFETESPALAGVIREMTTADDLIYNLGFQPELYFYADRDPPTRFLFDRPFGYDASYIERAVADLEARPPTLIIDSATYDGYMEDHYDPTPFRNFIADHYDFVGKIYYADIYRLRDGEDSQTR